MFRIGPKGQTDPALVAFFAQRGMVHVTGNVQLPGMWSLLGGISLNLFASPDGRFYATQMPFAGPSKQMLVSWMLEYAPMWAGESVSVVNDIKPAAAIVRDLVGEAEAALTRL